MGSDKHWWRRGYNPKEPGLYDVKWLRDDPDGGTTTMVGACHWDGVCWTTPGIVCWRPFEDGHAKEIDDSSNNTWRRTYDPEKPGHYEVQYIGADPLGVTTYRIGMAHWNGDRWDVAYVQCWRHALGHADDPGPMGPIASKDGTPGEEGIKHDSGKLRMDLIPPEAITALAEVLTYGARVYGDRNWEQGIKYSRIFAAVQRHLWAWWSGKDVDEESKLGHLQHALCGLAFLVTYEELGMIHMDDRE